MKSNYDILGNHIRLIDTRNRESITDRVLGIAKLGLKYQDYEMEQRHKQILKEMRLLLSVTGQIINTVLSSARMISSMRGER